jgi:hypothetical protein
MGKKVNTLSILLRSFSQKIKDFLINPFTLSHLRNILKCIKKDNCRHPPASQLSTPTLNLEENKSKQESKEIILVQAQENNELGLSIKSQ